VEPVVPEVDVPRPAEEEPQVAPRTLAGGPVVVELQAWPRVLTAEEEPVEARVSPRVPAGGSALAGQ
jgi:hypothetical protein